MKWQEEGNSTVYFVWLIFNLGKEDGTRLFILRLLVIKKTLQS